MSSTSTLHKPTASSNAKRVNPRHTQSMDVLPKALKKYTDSKRRRVGSSLSLPELGLGDPLPIMKSQTEAKVLAEVASMILPQLVVPVGVGAVVPEIQIDGFPATTSIKDDMRQNLDTPQPTTELMQLADKAALQDEHKKLMETNTMLRYMIIEDQKTADEDNAKLTTLLQQVEKELDEKNVRISGLQTEQIEQQEGLLEELKKKDDTIDSLQNELKAAEEKYAKLQMEIDQEELEVEKDFDGQMESLLAKCQLRIEEHQATIASLEKDNQALVARNAELTKNTEEYMSLTEQVDGITSPQDHTQDEENEKTTKAQVDAYKKDLAKFSDSIAINFKVTIFVSVMVGLLTCFNLISGEVHLGILTIFTWWQIRRFRRKLEIIYPNTEVTNEAYWQTTSLYQDLNRFFTYKAVDFLQLLVYNVCFLLVVWCFTHVFHWASQYDMQSTMLNAMQYVHDGFACAQTQSMIWIGSTWEWIGSTLEWIGSTLEWLKETDVYAMGSWVSEKCNAVEVCVELKQRVSTYWANLNSPPSDSDASTASDDPTRKQYQDTAW